MGYLDGNVKVEWPHITATSGLPPTTPLSGRIAIRWESALKWHIPWAHRYGWKPSSLVNNRTPIHLNYSLIYIYCFSPFIAANLTAYISNWAKKNSVFSHLLFFTISFKLWFAERSFSWRSKQRFRIFFPTIFTFFPYNSSCIKLMGGE